MVSTTTISGVFNLVSRAVEAKTSRDIAVNAANSKLLAEVLKDGTSGVVILGCGYFLYKGIRYVVDKNSLIELELIKDKFRFSIRTSR